MRIQRLLGLRRWVYVHVDDDDLPRSDTIGQSSVNGDSRINKEAHDLVGFIPNPPLAIDGIESLASLSALIIPRRFSGLIGAAERGGKHQMARGGDLLMPTSLTTVPVYHLSI